MLRDLQISLNERLGVRRDRHIAHLVAIALDAKVHHTFPPLVVADPERTELLAPDAVKEQDGQNRTVTAAYERVFRRGFQQRPRLRVTERRRRPFVGVRLGSCTPFTGFRNTALCSQRY
jgi:hypothetical protein